MELLLRDHPAPDTRASADQGYRVRPSLRRLVQAVSVVSRISQEVVYAERGTPRASLARQIVALIAREHGIAWLQIGRHFRRDHTTFVKGVQALERRMGLDYELRARIAMVRALAERPGRIGVEPKGAVVLVCRDGAWTLETRGGA